MNSRAVSLLAGGSFLAVLTASAAGYSLSQRSSSAPEPVTAVVRTDLGQLKWVVTQPTDFTPLEKAGRQVFVRERCWLCHSVDALPGTKETRRIVPSYEIGEASFDAAPTRSQGKIGPNLSREGLKYGNEWHFAHFWKPRLVTPDSIMKSFAYLYDAPPDPIKIVADGSGNKTLEKTAVTERLFDFSSKEQVKLTPNTDGLLFVVNQAKGKYPVIWTPNDEYTGDQVKIAAETPDIQALIAYVQKLGTNRGKWRDALQPQVLETEERGFAPAYNVAALPSLPQSPDWIAYGKDVYQHRCIGCHGSKGDGNGLAATFLYNQRPRNFTQGVFKFRLTKEPTPTDADLLRTITRGVRGTAMPSWADLPLTDRLAVIQYIKYELAVDRSDPNDPQAWFLVQPPGAPLVMPPPPAPTEALLSHGKDIWENAKCWECHGHGGQGNGEKAAGLKDDFGFPIRPANLAGGQFKSGARVEDIYRTISTGLSGTPMPSFRDSFPDQDRWALAYYVLSLSAFKDPLTGKALGISDADKFALDNPELEAKSPDKSYALHGGEASNFKAPVATTSIKYPVELSEVQPSVK